MTRTVVSHEVVVTRFVEPKTKQPPQSNAKRGDTHGVSTTLRIEHACICRVRALVRSTLRWARTGSDLSKEKSGEPKEVEIEREPRNKKNTGCRQGGASDEHYSHNFPNFLQMGVNKIHNHFSSFFPDRGRRGVEILPNEEEFSNLLQSRSFTTHFAEASEKTICKDKPNFFSSSVKCNTLFLVGRCTMSCTSRKCRGRRKNPSEAASDHQPFLNSSTRASKKMLECYVASSNCKWMHAWVVVIQDFLTMVHVIADRRYWFFDDLASSHREREEFPVNTSKLASDNGPTICILFLFPEKRKERSSRTKEET